MLIDKISNYKNIAKAMTNNLKLKISILKNDLLYHILWLFPIKRNKVVISNFLGKGYGDNCKYICEELLKNKGRYDIVWLLNDCSTPLPTEIRGVKIFTLKYLYELATAKVWIDNCRKPFTVKKRKGQYYIQT